MQSSNFLFGYSGNILIFLVFLVTVVLSARLFRMTAKGKDISTGLAMILTLTGAMMLLGTLGYFSELASATCKPNLLPGGSFVTVICTVVNSLDQASVIADCFGHALSSMLTGLLASLVSALMWLYLKHKEIN